MVRRRAVGRHPARGGRPDVLLRARARRVPRGLGARLRHGGLLSAPRRPPGPRRQDRGRDDPVSLPRLAVRGGGWALRRDPLYGQDPSEGAAGDASGLRAGRRRPRVPRSRRRAAVGPAEARRRGLDGGPRHPLARSRDPRAGDLREHGRHPAPRPDPRRARGQDRGRAGVRGGEDGDRHRVPGPGRRRRHAGHAERRAPPRLDARARMGGCPDARPQRRCPRAAAHLYDSGRRGHGRHPRHHPRTKVRRSRVHRGARGPVLPSVRLRLRAGFPHLGEQAISDAPAHGQRGWPARRLPALVYPVLSAHPLARGLHGRARAGP